MPAVCDGCTGPVDDQFGVPLNVEFRADNRWCIDPRLKPRPPFALPGGIALFPHAEKKCALAERAFGFIVVTLA
jgi:hypothetical protein